MNDRTARVDSLSWDSSRAQWQGIRNARPIPSAEQQRRLPMPIDVVAWIFWARDGLELIDTIATAWSGNDVLVVLNDPRQRVKGVGLPAQDVRRRT